MQTLQTHSVYPALSLWTVRTRAGVITELDSLTELGRLIANGSLTGDDELCSSNGKWTPLGEILDVQSLLLTLRALGHLS